jgi:hypothetical protein
VENAKLRMHFRLCVEFGTEGERLVPSDWVSKYLAGRRERLLSRDDRRQAALYAEAQAPELFRRLRDRVKNDIAEFCSHVDSADLVYQFVPSNKFIIHKGRYPSVHLEVELVNIFIRHNLKISKSQNEISNESAGQFVLHSDLDGKWSITSNSHTLSDESEIAEVLLRPIFDVVGEES